VVAADDGAPNDGEMTLVDESAEPIERTPPVCVAGNTATPIPTFGQTPTRP
jgi:hypothetical protein